MYIITIRQAFYVYECIRVQVLCLKDYLASFHGSYQWCGKWENWRILWISPWSPEYEIIVMWNQS